jgi:hypothetical protein
LSGQWQQKSHQSSFEAAGHGQRNKQYRHWTPHDAKEENKMLIKIHCFPLFEIPAHLFQFHYEKFLSK